MKKIEKQSNPSDEFIKGKRMLKYFGFSKPRSGPKDGETTVARTAMDVLIKDNNSRYIYIYIYIMTYYIIV